ncbi:hypothetical protein [Anaeromicrobium sediminis]|uniref:Uncharacterized protein n=1 Tax=Anaeromicrobium sediminis TaxID=1478221 RepID=A0A267MPF7_9FIRM|nr:hypothetical protein [Anaeromicrobium sediminis]PAB61327.1 hypothetical protein CCE28_02530 [Anaeromicrobium sediminis]
MLNFFQIDYVQSEIDPVANMNNKIQIVFYTLSVIAIIAIVVNKTIHAICKEEFDSDYDEKNIGKNSMFIYSSYMFIALILLIMFLEIGQYKSLSIMTMIIGSEIIIISFIGLRYSSAYYRSYLYSGDIGPIRMFIHRYTFIVPVSIISVGIILITMKGITLFYDDKLYKEIMSRKFEVSIIGFIAISLLWSYILSIKIRPKFYCVKKKNSENSIYVIVYTYDTYYVGKKYAIIEMESEDYIDENVDATIEFLYKEDVRLQPIRHEFVFRKKPQGNSNKEMEITHTDHSIWTDLCETRHKIKNLIKSWLLINENTEPYIKFDIRDIHITKIEDENNKVKKGA